MGLKGTFTIIKEGWVLFSQNVGVLWRHARFSFVMQMVSGCIFGIALLGATILAGYGLASGSSSSASDVPTVAIIASIITSILFIISFVGMTVYSLSYSIALTQTLGGRYLQKEIDTKNKYRLIWPMLGVSIMTSAIIFGGLLLLLIPALIFWTFYAFSVTARILDDQKGTKALNFSRSLSRGRFWKVLGRLLLINILFGAVIFGASFIPELVGNGIKSLTDSAATGTVTTIILSLVNAVFQIAFSVFFLAVSVVYYFNLKETVNPVSPAQS